MSGGVPLTPYEAIAIALASGDVKKIGDMVPQGVWEDLHERGLVDTRRTQAGDGDTFSTTAGDIALYENLEERRRHVVQSDGETFALRHSWDCGPDLLACDVHTLVRAFEPLAPGRYQVSLKDGEIAFLALGEDEA